jgi:5S rRNA maturation endonuclease (ribonuclease M5)
VALGRPLDTVPAPLIPPVAMWLERSRGLSVAEIGSMRALMTGLGPAVVFEYLRSVRSVQAVKVWPIDQKDRMFRSPVGAGALPLYGWERLEDVTADVASVVEGELDMHALRSVGIELVVSVPDGARTRITPALLAPLARFRRVVVAVDADQEGDGLAHRLGEALGSGRCRRVRFGQHKDANEALLAGWGREEFRRVLAGAAAEGA